MTSSFGSVLITGGSGFLGRALVRRLLETDASQRICVFSRGEHAQADMREELGNDSRMRFFIGDVRDYSRLKRAMSGVSLVIHAAALKRIEVGHYNPTEMIRTNVDGTVNAVEAAQDAGVAKFLFISSDKAFQPVSAYGQSKALAESAVLAANAGAGGKTKFAACRYGNVWLSTGSVVPKWLEAIKTHVMPTMTHPDCTRFFMTCHEAVSLVLDTASVMTGGELAIPDLPAYRLGTLAMAMGINPTVTGLPKWEKQHEGMGPDHDSAGARRMTVEELRVHLAEVMPRPALAPPRTAIDIARQIEELSCELIGKVSCGHETGSRMIAA
jgi:UDP-N-acetylglucosamine 4,6-dehydratase